MWDDLFLKDIFSYFKDIFSCFKDILNALKLIFYFKDDFGCQLKR